jgi:hypothetical protein
LLTLKDTAERISLLTLRKDMAERTRLCDLLTVMPKQRLIFCFDGALTAGGDVMIFMSIAALVLILLLPFGVGFVLNRSEAERRSRRFG